MQRTLVALALLALVGSGRACCSGMTMDALGLQLTEQSEGLRQTVYDDVAGYPTVCYGHKLTAGQSFPGVVPLSECQQLLQQDLGSAEACVQNAVTVSLNQNQFSALVDFTFNLGCGSLESSTLLRDLNGGDYAAVPAQLNRWVYAGGSVQPGLVTRRAAEGTLWNTPVGGSTAAATTPAAVVTTAAPAPPPATTAAPPATTAAPAPPPATTQAPAPATTAAVATTTGQVVVAAANAPSGSGSSSSGLSTTGTVLVVVGCVVAAAAICVALFVHLRARKPADLQENLLANEYASQI